MDRFAFVREQWGRDVARERPDLALPGSPDRCLSRTVVETGDGGLLVLERIGANQADRRQALGRLLDMLRTGLANGEKPGPGLIPAWLPVRTSPENEPVYVAQDWGMHWQLSPYVTGVELDRPGYLEDSELGADLGRFLADLGRAARQIPLAELEPDFFSLRLPDFAEDLATTMEKREPDLRPCLNPVLHVLATFFDQYDGLETGLCHGDLHPLNVIWSRRGVAAIIDWEFAGTRPLLYDLANCLGCLGIERHQGLTQAFAQGLLAQAGQNTPSGPLTPENLDTLFPLVLATRLGWLSEWLRRGDNEMLELELTFWDLLLKERSGLESQWRTMAGL